MDIDFGVAFQKPNGNSVKVTVNTFRDIEYLHIREYAMDGDTGFLYPTKTGFSMLVDEVSSVIALLEQVEIYASQKYANSNKQIEFNFEEFNDEKSVE